MDIITDPLIIAKKAQLRYVSDKKVKGITRQLRGENFVYFDPHLKQITDSIMIDRLNGLRIPPAWQNVWICPNDRGHIQAIGYDERGRKQYIYHPEWIEMMQQNKFNKVIFFGERLPRIRRHVNEDLALPGLPKERVLATLVWMLQHTFIRIGNEEYAKENQSFGLTTLREKHVEMHTSTVSLNFKGKSGVMHEVDITNPRVVKTIRKCVELPGYELFHYLDDNGKKNTIDSEDVNNYLKHITSDDFTAKDFRTWGGTVLAASTLNNLGIYDTKTAMVRNIRTAVKNVSQHLRNTIAVCKKYYIHPTVIQSYEEQELIPFFQKFEEKKTGLSPQEYALINLLRKYA
jgi:DNA topoisomerase-1